MGEDSESVTASKRSAVFHVVVAVLMVSTGSINTLTMKWADETSACGQKGVHEEERLCDALFSPIPCPQSHSHNCSTRGSHYHKFDHPIFQTLCMFLGELTCFFAFKAVVFIASRPKRSVTKPGAKPFNPLIFLFPALCDMTGSSIMIIGLTMTTASSFQMLRGAVIIFTGFLSVAFLGKRLYKHHWLGMVFVVGGLVIIGVGDTVYGGDSGPDKNKQLTGDLLVVMAQIIVAVQMTYEEKVVKKYQVPPLLAVGWEGIFGFSVLFLLQFPFYYMPVTFSSLRPERFENSYDAVIQLGNSSILIVSTVGLILSIAFFNFAGITVTKEMSATTRMVLDSVRTLFIWMGSLLAKWEKFQALDPVGYVLLVCGTFIYYDLVFAPLWKKLRSGGSKPEAQPLLADTVN
jgi:drug/metabolite transporter (DMT)-like permease